MGALVVPAILVLLAIVVGTILVVRFSRRERALADDLGEGDVPTLRYDVPEGQDVAALLAALRNEGYEAATDHDSGGRELLVSCPGGADTQRPRVRAVIQHAALNMEGDRADQRPVRFADE